MKFGVYIDYVYDHKFRKECCLEIRELQNILIVWSLKKTKPKVTFSSSKKYNTL
jgi:hypothetical protein